MTAYELKQHAYHSTLKSRALNVLVYLIDRANRDMTCFPAIPTIAAQLHISVTTVKRALKELEQSGYIRRDSRWRNNGGQSSNLYTLMAPVGAITDHEDEQSCETDKIEPATPAPGQICTPCPPVHPVSQLQTMPISNCVSQIALFNRVHYSPRAWTGEGSIMRPP